MSLNYNTFKIRKCIITGCIGSASEGGVCLASAKFESFIFTLYIIISVYLAFITSFFQSPVRYRTKRITAELALDTTTEYHTDSTPMSNTC